MRTKSIKGKYLTKQDRILIKIVGVDDKEYFLIFTRRMVIMSLNTMGRNLKTLLAQENIAKNPDDLDKALAKNKEKKSTPKATDEGPKLIQQIKFSTVEKNKIAIPMISFFYDEKSNVEFMFPIQLINILSRLLNKLHLEAHWNIPSKKNPGIAAGLAESKKENLH